MRRRALALLALTSALNWSASAQTSNVITDPEVYAVYASIPWSSWASPEHASGLAIAESTEDSGGGPSCFKRLPADWAYVADDYRRENFAHRKLVKGFNLGLPYDLLSAPDLRALVAREFEYSQRLADQPSPSRSLRPYEQLPGGKLITLSAVGFNVERTRAILSLSSTSSGPMNAEGWLLRRIKVNGVWRSTPEQPDFDCVWIY
jgi:hypothetical protein